MAGMNCVELDASAAAAPGFLTSPLAGAIVDGLAFFCSTGEGMPRFSTGRSGSVSAEGTGAAAAEGAGLGAGTELTGPGTGAVDAGADPAGGAGCAGSGDLGFSELA